MAWCVKQYGLTCVACVFLLYLNPGPFQSINSMVFYIWCVGDLSLADFCFYKCTADYHMGSRSRQQSSKPWHHGGNSNSNSFGT